MPVEAVWKPDGERTGSIMDIAYFRPRDPAMRASKGIASIGDEVTAKPAAAGATPASAAPARPAPKAWRARRERPARWLGGRPDPITVGEEHATDVPPATHMLVVRHRNRPGVLAHVFENLLASGMNVLETENTIFEDAEAAVARINIDGPLSDARLEAIAEGNGDIISLQLVSL